MITDSDTRGRRRPYVVRAKVTATSAAAASTIARQWHEQHGGTAVVLERGLLGLRRRLERYGPGRRAR